MERQGAVIWRSVGGGSGGRRRYFTAPRARGSEVMKAARLLLYSLLISAISFAQTLRTDPQLAKVIQEIRAETNGNEALDFVVRLHEKDRWFDFAKFQETAEYLRKTMNEIGLRKVELDFTPADGATQFGFWTMPLEIGRAHV